MAAAIVALGACGPDGWRGRYAKDFDEPIDQDEWHERMSLSTIDGLGRRWDVV